MSEQEQAEINKKLSERMETLESPTFSWSSLLPKTGPGWLGAFVIAGLLGGASIPDIVGAVQWMQGKPTAIVDTAPYELLNKRVHVLEDSDQKKNKLLNTISSEHSIMKTQMETILMMRGPR